MNIFCILPILSLSILLSVFVNSNDINSNTLCCFKKYINKNIICITRNEYLRLILSYSTNKIKQKMNIVRRLMIKNTLIDYNNLISKYYGLTYNYYCMSEDEKTILEFILSLTY